MPSDFSPDRFSEKLMTCNDTAASIKSLSGWILFHRRALGDMVDVWYTSYVAHSDTHQIIHLYVANDVMQTGLRKFGRDIPEAFADKLVMAIAHSMTTGTQKTQEIIRKLVNVWRDRHVLNIQTIDKMSDMCSSIAKSRKDVLKDTLAIAKQSGIQSTQEEEEIVLRDIPDAEDSAITMETIKTIEELETTIISTDLLSDRMFQLCSNLNSFMQAQEESKMDWSQLELPVFEINLESSTQQVEKYRDNLEEQLSMRTQVIQHFKNFLDYVVIDDDRLVSVAARMDQDDENMKNLYELCAQAAASREIKRQIFEASTPVESPPSLTRRHSMMENISTGQAPPLGHRHSDSELVYHQNHLDAWPQDPLEDSPRYGYASYPPAENYGYAPPTDHEWAHQNPRDYNRRSRSRSRSRSRNTSSWQDPRRRSEERNPRHGRRSTSRERRHPRYQESKYSNGTSTWVENDDSYGAPPKRYRQY